MRLVVMFIHGLYDMLVISLSLAIGLANCTILQSKRRNNTDGTRIGAATATKSKCKDTALARLMVVTHKISDRFSSMSHIICSRKLS